jgi:RNA 2',3'-cyclic 3'-phosphodiesterase
VEATPGIEEVLRRLEKMGSSLRSCAAENLHLTLAFLGETDEERFEKIAEAIEESCAGCGPFALELAGLGAFPSIQRPNNVWVGARDGHPLSQIVEKLRPRLNALGISTDERPWNVHLTLARVKFKPPAELGQMLRSHRETAFGSAGVGEILLMTSELLPEGARHSVARVVELKG